ncbi:MAG: hypothetical protein K5798_01970 [Nitrosopumilus sp.]|uniref:hypothetical protein n=1 Tax=Nitrosopumilus sp. TaxID=2024843 RepID=UPI00242CFFF8|nr:hypothetical protein [Nitrosopumilus sp.]MCV0366016.1 hypothetical protein [Nitrosopumilus sp.]
MSCNEIISNDEIKPESPDRYLTHSEMEQFKIDCPLCGKTATVLEFSEHIRTDTENILEK